MGSPVSPVVADIFMEDFQESALSTAPVTPRFYKRFSKDERKRNEWLKSIGRPNWTPKHHSRICSRHFTSDSFESGEYMKWRRLRDDAVPTLFLMNGRVKWSTPTSMTAVQETNTRESDVSKHECRACLQTIGTVDKFNLFQPWSSDWKGMEYTIAEDLAKVANIQISEADRHPKFICKSCCVKLQDACEFVCLVRENDRLLRLRFPPCDNNDVNGERTWPKPIQIDKNVPYNNDLEVDIKQEVLSEEEYNYNVEDGYREAEYINNLEIKVEPEEIVEIKPSQIIINEIEKRRPIANSSLPPVAENIQKEMPKVWIEVLCENVKKIENCIQKPNESIKILQALTSQSIADSKVPTSFKTEVPSSSKNSPAISIKEIEECLVSTPISSHLTLSTPMPSPMNTHSNNVFCPDHIPCIDLTPSENKDVPDSTSVQNLTEKWSKGKHEWSDVTRKNLTNLGKCYISKRGQFVNNKVMGKPCTCKYKCGTKISEEQRSLCFRRFWKLGTREKQWGFVVKYVTRIVKDQCLNRSTPNKRQITFKYSMPLIKPRTDVEPEEHVNVCKVMFLNTLAVSERIVSTAFQKYDGIAEFEEDNRGRHKNHKCVINEDMTRSVCDHVNSFTPVESHFIGKDPTKLYLVGSLSICRMFKLYNEWFDENVYLSKVKTNRHYRYIVHKNFNLGFHKE